MCGVSVYLSSAVAAARPPFYQILLTEGHVAATGYDLQATKYGIPNTAA